MRRWLVLALVCFLFPLNAHSKESDVDVSFSMKAGGGGEFWSQPTNTTVVPDLNQTSEQFDFPLFADARGGYNYSVGFFGQLRVIRHFGIEVRQLSIRRATYTTGSVTTVMTDPERRAWKLGWSRKIAGENNPFSPNRGSEIGLRPRDHFVHEASLHADLHYMLAGAAAQNIQYGPYASWEGNGWESDLRRFHLLVSAHYGNLDGFISDSSVASILDRYWKSCEEILSKPEIRLWHQAVVKAALRSEHGVLSGEEIDALRTMAIDPLKLVAVPKMWAMLLSVPLLTIMADFVGLLGGTVTGVLSLDISPATFFNRVTNALLLKDIITGLIKSLSFAWVITIISVFRGLQFRGGAAGVGNATTSAVVSSIFAIIVLDLTWGLIFYLR